MKPLFIPLKAEYFDAFERGEKSIEYRRFGQRWNYETCVVGRPVILSRGYGRHRRLTGTIVSFRPSYFTKHLPELVPGWLECYGPNDAIVACITIQLSTLP